MPATSLILAGWLCAAPSPAEVTPSIPPSPTLSAEDAALLKDLDLLLDLELCLDLDLFWDEVDVPPQPPDPKPVGP
jgi:hypothetical protein